MRYPAAEKLEIIRLVKPSHLPVRRTLTKIVLLATTFHRWYGLYVMHQPEALGDLSSRPCRVWNRILREPVAV
jgi:putative transposase